ncbi:PucR family transcriptional regulator [Nocardiopsis ansamitocini]|uniref:PucR family transcriptional regulator n=1 Tax=Nocardiopsis ansamitocini TaxID=1670832 RepID=UPI002552482E|nr:helix-turn-helix domain-containing protein [Nocardiopsis ansamitocini]
MSTVVDALGATVLSVWADAPEGDVRCADVVIHEESAEFAAGPGDVLLAVGVDAERALLLLEQAARCQVAAVVVRRSAALKKQLSAPARRAGVALLGLSSDMGWAQFTGHLRGLLSTTGADLDGESPGPPSRALADFANALSESVGGSVMIFNPQQEVLAFSRLAESDDPMRRQAVLDQRGPSWYRSRLRERGVYRRLWRSDEVVEIPAEVEQGVSRRIAVAVRSGEEILGSIWVAERGAELVPDATTVLHRCTSSAAQHLSRLGARTQTRRLAAEAVARQLLSGDSDDEAVEWLDIDRGQPAAVMSCVFVDEHPHDPRRFADLLSVHLPALGCVAVPVPARGRVDVLLCGLAGRDCTVLAAAVREIVERASAVLGSEVVAALGPIVADVARVPESLAEAGLILRVLGSRGIDRTCVVRSADVRAAVDVLALADIVGSSPRFSSGPVPELLAYDRAHHSDYTASLSAYLDSLGDVIAAARVLHVHPNTLRYRLRRMHAICGIDLNDPEERLIAALHLRGAGLDHATTGSAKGRTAV